MRYDILMELFRLLGGAGLFIFGMKIMTNSLENAASNKLRTILSKITGNQFNSLLVGTVVAFLVHSGAATVMIVGFINSGLMAFTQSIGVIIGANIGTTLSMQIISFEVGKYCFFAIAVGFLMEMFSKNNTVKNIGMIILGFGILFLGIETMKEAVAPFKNSQYITNIFKLTNASTISGMVIGILASTIITGIMQSSGAMIGILFALCGSGIITDFQSVFPLIIGAHIGTCFVTIIGAIGTNISARRSAWAHLMFNVIGAIIAAFMFPLYAYIVPKLSGNNLVREVANAHTMVQIVNGIILVLLAKPFAKLICSLIGKNETEEQGTYLSDDLISTPERAIVAAINELERMMKITQRMLKNLIEGLTELNQTKFNKVLIDETVIDRLKIAIEDYLMAIGQLRISDRQSVLIQYINLTTIDIERIGDHIEKMIEITNLRLKKQVWFDKENMKELKEIFGLLDAIYVNAINAINPAKENADLSKQNLIKDDKEANEILELVRFANVHNQKPLVQEELKFIAKHPDIARKILTMSPLPTN